MRAAFGLLAVAFAGCVASPPRVWVLEVSAGERSRQDSIVEWPLPESLHDDGPFELVRLEGDRETSVPVQVLPGGSSVAWIVAGELAAGESRRYRLRPGSAEWDDVVDVLAADGDAVVRVDGRELLRYRARLVDPPDGVGPVYARSGYLHPVWSPAGRVVTGDFPPSHRHQHGIFFPWTKTTFEGRPIDFWNAAERQGRIESAGIEASSGGPVAGWFRARQRHVDLTAPRGEVVALDEVWELRAWAVRGASVFDLVSVQSCASESPLRAEEYAYGGLGFRGPVAWEGEAATFVTGGGLGRVDGNGARPGWCAVAGPVDGATACVAVLDHPGNFRYPQPVRMHPSNPYFCYAPSRLGPFEIHPDRPLVSRYRFVVTDGPPDPELLDRLLHDWCHPPEVRIVDG